MNLKNKTAISAVAKSFIYVAVLRDTALKTSGVIELDPERDLAEYLRAKGYTILGGH